MTCTDVTVGNNGRTTSYSGNTGLGSVGKSSNSGIGAGGAFGNSGGSGAGVTQSTLSL